MRPLNHPFSSASALTNSIISPSLNPSSNFFSDGGLKSYNARALCSGLGGGGARLGSSSSILGTVIPTALPWFVRPFGFCTSRFVVGLSLGAATVAIEFLRFWPFCFFPFRGSVSASAPSDASTGLSAFSAALLRFCLCLLLPKPGPIRIQ